MVPYINVGGIERRGISLLQLETADINEYVEILRFYDTVTDQLQGAEYSPGWIKRVYPTEDYLRESLRQKELFVARIHSEIVGVMVLNHETAAGYDLVEWQVQAEAKKVTILHAFAVADQYQRRGFGRQMVQAALDLARAAGQEAVRLDVLADNLPPQKLYAKMGFAYRGTQTLFYEDTGLTDYKLYEYALNPEA